MNSLIPYKLNGDGKYLLLSRLVEDTEIFFLRGGKSFEMHKDIVIQVEAELGVSVNVYGGGRVEINESISQIIFSGSSQRYGALLFPEKVEEIIKATYPGWLVLFL